MTVPPNYYPTYSGGGGALTQEQFGALPSWEQYILGRFPSGQGGRQQRPLREYYGMGVDPSQIVETPGTQPGFGVQDPRSYISELGFTEQLPGRHTAAQTQYYSDRITAERNADLAEKARQQYEMGLGDIRSGYEAGMSDMHNASSTLSSYRPGGVAGLASGIFGQQAAMSMQYGQNMAGQRGRVAAGYMQQQTQSPDLMFEFERHLMQREARFASRAMTNQLIGAGISAAASIAGAGIGAAGMMGAAKITAAASKGAPGMAEGGYVPPKPGGHQVTVGEGGEGEFVVPESKASDFLQARQQGETTGQPAPLQSEDSAQQQAGRTDDNADRAAAMQPMGEGFSGDAMVRVPGDPGMDGYGVTGASHYVSQRLGLPADMIHAISRVTQYAGEPSLGEVVSARLRDLVSSYDRSMAAI